MTEDKYKKLLQINFNDIYMKVYSIDNRKFLNEKEVKIIAALNMVSLDLYHYETFGKRLKKEINDNNPDFSVYKNKIYNGKISFYELIKLRDILNKFNEDKNNDIKISAILITTILLYFPLAALTLELFSTSVLGALSPIGIAAITIGISYTLIKLIMNEENNFITKSFYYFFGQNDKSLYLSSFLGIASTITSAIILWPLFAGALYMGLFVSISIIIGLSISFISTKLGYMLSHNNESIIIKSINRNNSKGSLELVEKHDKNMTTHKSIDNEKEYRQNKGIRNSQ
jgi:hypothetical protein